MGFLSSIFGGNSESKVLLEKGAIVIDVRTESEFQNGHVKDSINIPLNIISNQIERIKKLDKPLVLCCASGARSGQAESLLKAIGIECVNGGSWGSVNSLTK